MHMQRSPNTIRHRTRPNFRASRDKIAKITTVQQNCTAMKGCTNNSAADGRDSGFICKQLHPHHPTAQSWSKESRRLAWFA